MTDRRRDTMRRVYLAARYSRNDEMRGVRDVLVGLVPDLTVTSRWIDLHDGSLDRSFRREQLNEQPELCTPYAVADWVDVMACDTLISFTEADGGGKGGRHVELGAALAFGKRCIVIGQREHVFHAMPEVEWHADWSRFVMWLTREFVDVS